MAEENELPLREYTSDPKRYARCSEPFENEEVANAAVKAFLDEVEALRDKHKIADFCYVIKDSMIADDSPGAFLIAGHFGDSMNEELMLAYALGQVTKSREQQIAKLLAGIGFTSRRRK